eukprot:CAMPEP_0174743082 /NCGR_PEP_ID=MMETSP1094-20130205/80691_1 /TAXON_ID=156173 /ORGANISM="Chrysochromulina brevifilum, Strain UTEX LB 985" /LENGTH=56 /DNA_ID=CAMNT_0015947243 /DNA_START=178 /DNA_END=346 /DNA_ORIENTATION=+
MALAEGVHKIVTGCSGGVGGARHERGWTADSLRLFASGPLGRGFSAVGDLGKDGRE